MRPLVLLLCLASCGPEDPALAKRDPNAWKDERLGSGTPAPLRSADERIRRADDFMKQERLAEAGAEYRSVLSQDPLSIPALVGLSRVSTRMNDPSASLTFISRAAQLRPQDAALVNEMAVAQVVSGKRQEAALTFEKARALNPNDPLISINESLNLADLGRWDAAQRAVERAAAALPKDPTPWLLMGRFQMRQERNAEALPYLLEAAKRGPSDGLVHYHLGKVLIASGRKGDAAAAFQVALKSSPPDEIRKEIEGLLAAR